MKIREIISEIGTPTTLQTPTTIGTTPSANSGMTMGSDAVSISKERAEHAAGIANQIKQLDDQIKQKRAVIKQANDDITKLNQQKSAVRR